MVQPDDKQRKKETQIGQGQCRQIIRGTTQFQVRPCEHEEAERVAYHAEDDDNRQVVKVEKVQAHFCVTDFSVVEMAPVRVNWRVTDAAVVHSTEIVSATFTHIANNAH